MASMIDPAYPEPDPEREQRIVGDVIALMKLANDEAGRTMVARWLRFTLAKAQRFNRLPWWFARRYFACMVYEGQDVFDFQGELNRIITVSCPCKLLCKSINHIIDRRASAYSYNHSNLGEPQGYAIHGGRLHLWPAPKTETMLSVTYACNLTPDIVPDEWEHCLVDGIIGLYGVHFDSSGMLNDKADFAGRFYEGLKSARTQHFDTETFNRTEFDYATGRGLTISQAYAETNSVNYSNAILKPAYDGAPGTIQILSDKDEMTQNQRSTPISQIPGG